MLWPVEPLSFLVLVVLGAIGALGSIVVEKTLRWLTRPVTSQPERTLEHRLADLGDLMRWSARILEEVQAEIEARITLATKAKQDAEEAERVAQLNEAQRVAIARLVRTELAREFAKTSRRTFWQGFMVNFLFFVSGGVLSVITTLWLGT